MEILVSLIVLAICFIYLACIVDNYFLKSLDNIADWLKLSPSVAGATLMAIGTSAPELSTAMFALFLPNTNPATGLGTIVGSALFQILVVIGFASLVKTSYLNWKPVVRDGVFYTFSIIALVLVLLDGNISVVEGGIFLSLYVLYLLVLILWTKYVKESDPDPIELFEEGLEEESKGSPVAAVIDLMTFPLRLLPDPSKKERATIPVFILSLVGIAGISYVLVISAETLASGLGVPAAIIALTILAGGTSVPELISSAIVAKQGRGDMAISNAIGSNIFDILISLGLPVFIYTLINGDLAATDTENINTSILLLFATMIMVLLLLASQRFKAGRLFGLILCGLYVVYVIAAYAGLL
ncbi:MAG: Inner membrane protein YrbG [candidate division WS6 bacterium OLB20]|uniref:Inner membrane protein YrbG n=1 Tax=candidate division WS6 bacterium OLB20 TaxID=1617426 RepID=A0A136M041_9BACT|nr:MAG: Inner membrane protein YrbG [candidate division WS6 bacterium OLB20]